MLEIKEAKEKVPQGMERCWHHQDEDESKEFLNVNHSRQGQW